MPSLVARSSSGSAEALLWRRFFLGLACITAVFSLELYQWARFAGKSELYSYALLIPFAALYLVWRTTQMPTPKPKAMGVFIAAAAFLWSTYRLYGAPGKAFSAHQDAVAEGMLLVLVNVFAVALWQIGRRALYQLKGAFLFLLFAVPLPQAWERGADLFLQHGSAAVARILFAAFDSPVVTEELHFRLPGITLEVATECSGIHASLVLFVVSLFAGQLLLTTTRNRILLCAVVIPLALFRNGFRIFVIGQLCIRSGPEMINSFLHRQGGPLFFTASLIPFLAALWYLAQTEKHERSVAV